MELNKWVPMEDVVIPDEVKFISVDTRDFHWFMSEELPQSMKNGKHTIPLHWPVAWSTTSPKKLFFLINELRIRCKDNKWNFLQTKNGGYWNMKYIWFKREDEEWYTAEELLDYNDNPNETPKNKEEKKINQMSLANCDLDEVEIVLGDKFELKIEDGKYYAVRKKSKYPTTYAECCEFLGKIKAYQSVSGYKTELLEDFQKILICRDAYWKIAGEQMGLDKPWEHNYLKDANTIRYAIYNTGDEIVKLDGKLYRNYILCFPTEEMRDVFYENFKDLIEQCKELL